MPVYRQIIDQVRGGIASGLLAAGDQLPTVRQLAVDLAINPNTVVRAYRELEFGGLIGDAPGHRHVYQRAEDEAGRCGARAAIGADCGRLRLARRSGGIHGGRTD
jgi:DNA-binding transcriptional regulator YhcF (GntR family)